MVSTLEALHELQVIETKLAAIRRRRESKHKRIENLKRQVHGAQNRIDEHDRSVREKQIRQDSLSLDVAAQEEAIAHQRDALGKAKTNKAYAEILTAMNTTKADNSKLESGILQLMEEIQVLETDGKGIQQEKAELEDKVKAAEKQLHEFDEKHRNDRDKLEGSREECAAAIPGPALAMFSRVAARHDGEAMAAVFKLHPKRHEYACQGCNMQITLEVVNALHKNNDLQLCGSCGRVLYLDTAVG